jgi:hypothetical protein
MGRSRGGASRDDVNIKCVSQTITMCAEKLPAHALETVACHGIPDFFSNSDAEAGVGMLTTIKNNNEMPTDKALSFFA